MSRAIVTPSERGRFNRQVAALADGEIDDEGSPQWRAAMIEALDRRRAVAGVPPLEPWWAGKGERELHERARALGLLRPLR